MQAEAAPILGTATSFTGGTGVLSYQGLGENPAASGLGTGRYALGSCLFDGTDTTCTLTGTYLESAGSSNDPGGVGTFSFRLIYAGSGPSPVVARSTTPGGSILNIFALNGGHFALDLFPSTGGSFSGVFPDTPFAQSIGWSGFLGSGATCTGAPSACTIGAVGLTPGSTLTGGLSSFSFSIPQPDPLTTVPEPTSFVLVASALAGLAVRGRRS
jgi:hypothetical protein